MYKNHLYLQLHITVIIIFKIHLHFQVVLECTGDMECSLAFFHTALNTSPRSFSTNRAYEGLTFRLLKLKEISSLEIANST